MSSVITKADRTAARALVWIAGALWFWPLLIFVALVMREVAADKAFRDARQASDEARSKMLESMFNRPTAE